MYRPVFKHQFVAFFRFLDVDKLHFYSNSCKTSTVQFHSFFVFLMISDFWCQQKICVSCDNTMENFFTWFREFFSVLLIIALYFLLSWLGWFFSTFDPQIMGSTNIVLFDPSNRMWSFPTVTNSCSFCNQQSFYTLQLFPVEFELIFVDVLMNLL